jgi:hypothetical protein
MPSILLSDSRTLGSAKARPGARDDRDRSAPLRLTGAARSDRLAGMIGDKGSHGLALVNGWHFGRIAERSVDDELKAAEPHLSLLADMGCKVVFYGETGRMPRDPLAPLSARALSRGR